MEYNSVTINLRVQLAHDIFFTLNLPVELTQQNLFISI